MANEDRLIGRRTLLAAGAAAAANYFLGGALPRAWARVGEHKHIVVVGAGLAGLVAAYELQKLGHKVTVLEAQERAGGRVSSYRVHGVWGELGAARIHSSHEDTMRYAREFSLPLIPFATNSGLAYVRGQVFDADNERGIMSKFHGLTSDERRVGVEKLFYQKFDTDLAALHYSPLAYCKTAEGRQADQSTYGEFARSKGFSADAIDVLGLGYVDYKTDPMSALTNLLCDAMTPASGRLYCIKGGNDLLPAGFVERLKQGTVRYQCVVDAIRQEKQSAVVEYTNNRIRTRVQCDFVICTVPLTVLSKIAFEPPLSQSKQQASHQVTYVPVVKTFFETKTRYWAARGLNGYALTDYPSEIWSCPDDRTVEGLLTAYVVDHAQGERLSKLPQEKVISEMEGCIDKVFPGLQAQKLSAAVKYWRADPWVHGAYVSFGAGQFCRFFPSLSKPEGRVFFAGEHTSIWMQWMQGALESGLRATNEVVSAINQTV